MTPFPYHPLHDVCLMFVYSHTFDGRNVGPIQHLLPRDYVQLHVRAFEEKMTTLSPSIKALQPPGHLYLRRRSPSSLVLSSCGKNIASTEVLAPVTSAGADATAGSWKMIVLTGPTQIAVPAPAPVTDPTYPGGTRDNQDGAGHPDRRATPVHHLLECGRRATLERGSTRAGGPRRPSTSSKPKRHLSLHPIRPTPSNYPNYPFSNPPYAARAYSYVSVAQYEALKDAWYYKFLYNRPSPSKVDTTIQALLAGDRAPPTRRKMRSSQR